MMRRYSVASSKISAGVFISTSISRAKIAPKTVIRRLTANVTSSELEKTFLSPSPFFWPNFLPAVTEKPDIRPMIVSVKSEIRALVAPTAASAFWSMAWPTMTESTNV